MKSIIDLLQCTLNKFKRIWLVFIISQIILSFQTTNHLNRNLDIILGSHGGSLFDDLLDILFDDLLDSHRDILFGDLLDSHRDILFDYLLDSHRDILFDDLLDSHRGSSLFGDLLGHWMAHFKLFLLVFFNKLSVRSLHLIFEQITNNKLCKLFINFF